jgi:hypothetical protein
MVSISLLAAAQLFTQGDLTPNFPTFLKPILNLDFYINADPGQGQLQEWTEHSHTDLPKSETSRDIKKSF